MSADKMNILAYRYRYPYVLIRNFHLITVQTTKHMFLSRFSFFFVIIILTKNKGEAD